MKTVTLDLAHIETVRALHVYLQYRLDLPEYYGKNLDALSDCLFEIAEDTRVIIRTEGCAGELPAYLPRLFRVFEDAAKENVRLELG